MHGIQERLRRPRDVLRAAGVVVEAPAFERRANLYRPPATSEDSAALRQEAHGFHGVFENVLRQRGAAKKKLMDSFKFLRQRGAAKRSS